MLLFPPKEEVSVGKEEDIVKLGSDGMIFGDSRSLRAPPSATSPGGTAAGFSVTKPFGRPTVATPEEESEEKERCRLFAEEGSAPTMERALPMPGAVRVGGTSRGPSTMAVEEDTECGGGQEAEHAGDAALHRVLHPASAYQDPPPLLRPLSARHDRAGHAERRALSLLLGLIFRLQQNAAGSSASSSARNGASTQSPQSLGKESEARGTAAGALRGGARGEKATRGVLKEPSGWTMLYASHTPCLSCLGAMCQFQGLMPRTRLSVSFDDWRLTRAQFIATQTPT